MSTQSSTHNETIRQLVQDLVAAWNAHDLERAAAFYSLDFEGSDVAQPAPQRGPAGIRQTMALYFQAFPDLHFVAESIIVQDDQAVLVWTAYGKHQGKVMNIPPTGRSIKVKGTSLLTISEGKIRRASYIWDVAGLLRDLGLLPEL
jgi:steroid delta-isomerase-like uncharacterized protein